jgi:hypothetical protein
MRQVIAPKAAAVENFGHSLAPAPMTFSLLCSSVSAVAGYSGQVSIHKQSAANMQTDLTPRFSHGISSCAQAHCAPHRAEPLCRRIMLRQTLRWTHTLHSRRPGAQPPLRCSGAPGVL